MERQPIFDVVFLCTGNRFRSPLAEGVLRHATARSLCVQVRSLGLLPVEDEPALQEAIELGKKVGIDLSTHRSRCLDGVDLAGADLVIGFEYNHLARAVMHGRADYRKTFLLPELVGYLEQVQLPPGDPVARASEAVAAAAALRSQSAQAPPQEITDPAGKPLAECEQAVNQIVDLTARLVRLLFPT
jgi:protein-tyrosine-phosphatase